MSKKNVIWFIGSNASGKTTQSKKFHEGVSDKSTKKIVNKKDQEGNRIFEYTIYDNSGHVGALRDNQCTGTDSLGTKDMVVQTYNKLCGIEHISFILLDPIMSTGKYVEFLRKFDSNIMLIHLHFPSVEDNLKRIDIRRSNKGVHKPMDPKTIENITRKNKTYLSLFNSMRDKVDCCLQINANESEEAIHIKVMEFVYENMLD